MSGMFFNCYSLKEIKFQNCNTKNVINMAYMFYNCLSLEILDLSDLDTNKVIE